MKRKNLMFVVVMMMMANAIVFAQHTGRENGVNKRMEYMKKTLSLTDNQGAKVKAILEKHELLFKTLSGDSTLSREKKMDEMKKLKEKEKAEIKTVLTEAQYTQWDKLKKENGLKKKDGDRKKGAYGSRQRMDADYMKTALSLTDDQVTKVKAIQQKYQLRFKTLRSDSTLSREKKTDELKKLMEVEKADLKTILTEAQYTQWNKLKQERGDRKNVAYGDRQRLDPDRMKAALSLTDDQYAKIKAIETKFVDHYKTLKVDSTVSRETVRAEWKKLGEEKNTAIKGVLTPDQYTKWSAMKADRRKKQDGNRNHNNRNHNKG